MIARTVTKHTPENTIKKEFFNQFIVSKKKLNNKIKVFNIDEIKIN